MRRPPHRALERGTPLTLSRRSINLAVLAVSLTTANAVAQVTYPNVRVQGRLQVQYYYFDNSDYASVVGPKDNFFLRRARIEARANINEYISVFIQPSFEGGRTTTSTTTCQPVIVTGAPDTVAVNCTTTSRGGIRLRDAFIDVRFTKPEAKTSFMLRMGQEKRPFGRYELTSANNLPSIERGAGQGLVGAGSNDLFTAQGFLSHDVGAHLQFDYKLSDLRLLTLIAGAYNGRGESLNDNNNAKSFGFRGTVGITDKLNVGGSFFSHDNIVTPTGASAPDSNYTNSAWGLDAQWGKPGDAGLYLVGDYMSGQDGSGVLVSGDKKTILGISAVGAYNIRIKSPTSWLTAIEPAVRYDFADPDTELDDNGTTLITVVLGFYMSSRAQFRIAYENESFQAGGAKSISGVRSALTVNF
ncbi:MAG TPA: porin [Gemmatimonadales bacterium]